jgi:hypothetical protein
MPPRFEDMDKAAFDHFPAHAQASRPTSDFNRDRLA